MIRVDKSTVKVPKILNKGKGFAMTNQLKTDFDNGIRSFDFDSKIYGNKSVKSLLIKIQHKKCCFCERYRPYARECDVEHFRPKGGYQVDESLPLIQPGYYWLAYDFSNLFYSCKTCNQAYKKNFFPLSDETKRAKNHNDDLSLEESLLIHPEFDDPQNHITFVEEIAKPINDSIKGKTTIKYLGLNDSELLKERFDYLRILKIAAVEARKGEPTTKNLFKELSKPQNMFSMMVRCNFPDLV
ncbi:MAG: hypothetical protein MUF45_11250 [Spirosomaceae bacterium]|jgi:uncharacterized protein (TIGR02646 family)|nr:hypothetical protein [Spirosomataceae bacterium]